MRASEQIITLLGGASIPVAPTGFAYYTASDGSYVLNSQGNYILVRAV